MFIRAIVPVALLATVVAAFLAAFHLRAPELRIETAAAVASYEAVEEPLAKLQSGAAQLSSVLAGTEIQAESSHEHLATLNNILTTLTASAEQEKARDAMQHEAVAALVNVSKQQAQESGDVLSTVLSNMLGEPIGQSFGNRSTVKVYSLKEAGYRGYLAKVKLSDPSAIDLLLSGDKIGHKGETTSAAAKRSDAVLAINAGGFSKGKDGLLYPLGVTVVDGKIVAFYQTGLPFIGFNRDGNLIGGEVNKREDIEAMDVSHGATFVPTLLKDGKKQKIPAKWKDKKEPRTLIGHFSNGDLLFVVIDGRQKGYSNGVTLEEAQTKLLEWNVRDAYNLDGGGSSAFVYKGKLLNSPSDGKQRKVVSNFVVLP
ncbi:phosphodiester glycosidase family protein [Paenibacillus sp. TRM 82003]|nr:phosphodiester glycosidase family protein [Paenibacillus sp. TRM 82003]